MSEFSSAYEKLKQSAQKDGVNAASAEFLEDANIRQRLGVVVDGLTIAQVANLRRKLIKELRQEEDKSAADWLCAQVLSNFPQAECEIKRIANRRVAVLHLDGKAEELPLGGELSG